MIYDINQMLKKGAEFPPRREVPRIDGYKINDMLLNDDAWAALPAYQVRVNTVLSNFLLPSNYLYYYSANHWADLVAKLQELTYGENPDIVILEEKQTDDMKGAIAEILSKTEFFEKAKEGCADFVSLGEWVTKAVKTKDGMSFINVDPSTWFPIVSRENVKEIKAHVLAWVADVDEKRKELHVQIHEKGRYTNRAFEIKNYNPNSTFTDPTTKQTIEYCSCIIGNELQKSATDFELKTESNGLSADEFAVIVSANNPKPRTVYGTSDFDFITSAALEYNVRMTLKNVVLDKHSAPKLYGPYMQKQSDNDDNAATVGNYIELDPGEGAPGYLTWDANMQAVENSINSVKDDIANLSGMGSLLNSKTFGESQGYDALMIKLAPALMRSKGKKDTLEKHLKKLISVLSASYGARIAAEDVSVMWHDGIPTTESVRADIARKHLATGWSNKRVLMQDYGFSEEDAEEEVEAKRLETPAMPSFGVDEGSFGNEQGGDDTE